MRTTTLRILGELRNHIEHHLHDVDCGCPFAVRDPTFSEFLDLIDWINEEKGWNKERDASEWAALFHTEISEYYEEFRKGKDPNEVYYSEGFKPEGQAVELADELIRIFHWFARQGLNPATYMMLKERYNITRPYRHGGKRT